MSDVRKCLVCIQSYLCWLLNKSYLAVCKYLDSPVFISFVAIAMISRDQYKITGLRKISHSIKQRCIRSSVCLKKALKMLFKQCSNLSKESKRSNILINSKLLKFQTSPKFCQPTSLPQDLVPLGVGLQIFHRLCTVVLDLRIS